MHVSSEIPGPPTEHVFWIRQMPAKDIALPMRANARTESDVPRLSESMMEAEPPKRDVPTSDGKRVSPETMQI